MNQIQLRSVPFFGTFRRCNIVLGFLEFFLSFFRRFFICYAEVTTACGVCAGATHEECRSENRQSEDCCFSHILVFKGSSGTEEKLSEVRI